jgi:pimeloyl-ACP methyl ester carboxylesterase
MSSQASPLFWFRNIALGLLALILLLALAGALYQAVGNWRDSRRFPQQGKLFQAGSVKLNIDCSGAIVEGKPTIILESSGASPGRVWAKVQPEIAKFSRVCSYDRAGLGWSEPATTPRTRQQEAEELRLLLAAAGERAPYVMVGISQGGLTVQAFTHKYPDLVAGVVLVDASHPDTDKRTVAVLSKAGAEQYITFNNLLKSDAAKQQSIWSARLGLTRLLTPANDKLDEEINYLSGQLKAIETCFEEFKLYDESADKIRTIGNLGDRPLIVLTGGKEEGGFYASPQDQAAAKKLWVYELQKEMAGLSTRGQQVIVPDSGHMIPFDKPMAVVKAVKEVWEQACADLAQ